MIPGMLSNKKLNPIVTELFIRGRKSKFYLVFITQAYFAVSKTNQTRLNTLFCYENPKQKRASKNGIHQILTFKTF